MVLKNLILRNNLKNLYSHGVLLSEISVSNPNGQFWALLKTLQEEPGKWNKLVRLYAVFVYEFVKVCSSSSSAIPSYKSVVKQSEHIFGEMLSIEQPSFQVNYFHAKTALMNYNLNYSESITSITANGFIWALANLYKRDITKIKYVYENTDTLLNEFNKLALMSSFVRGKNGQEELKVSVAYLLMGYK